nr:uncharacterized protein LOC103416745 [Malus domestica]
MAECIFDLDRLEDLPESLELVEFLCAEPDKSSLKVQDPLETIDLGTKEYPRLIQISGLLEEEDQAKIVSLLHEFKDYCQDTTNNWVEYEALIIGLEILIKLGTTEVQVFGDSELVINQLNGEYKCRQITMAGYYLATTQLLSYWDTKISVSHIPRESNAMANEMAHMAYRAHIQGQEESMRVMAEVHEGICGVHYAGTKMR